MMDSVVRLKNEKGVRISLSRDSNPCRSVRNLPNAKMPIPQRQYRGSRLSITHPPLLTSTANLEIAMGIGVIDSVVRLKSDRPHL